MKFIIYLFFVSYIVCSPNCRILALSGGGAHGSFEVGVLKKLSQIGYNWDIITGVSAGAINTGLLGMYSINDLSLAINDLVQLWFNMTPNKVYSVNFNPIWDGSLYDNSPLNNTIYNIINSFKSHTKRPIMISTTNMNTGQSHIFTNKHMNSAINIVDIIMSSSSIPVFFPPRFMNNSYYIDGGVYSNELIDSAVDHCINVVGSSNISIDVILCSQPLTNITNSEIKSDTIFGIMGRSYDIMLNALFNHELYKHCNNKSYPMYIYKPILPFKGGIMDFNRDDIKYNYYIGVNSYVPIVTKYCF